MGEPVFYMRGLPGAPWRPGVRESMVSDMRSLIKLEENVLHGLMQEVARAPGFIDYDALRGLVGSAVSDIDEEQVSALSRTIVGLRSLARDYGQTTSDVLKQLKQSVASDDNPNGTIPIEDYHAICARVSVIDRTIPGIDLQDKASRLAKTTGMCLEEVQLICDLRPVFNDDRTAVRGYIPFTTLRLVCEGVDGLPVAMEAILSKDQVADLEKKVNSATTKLATLAGLVERQGLPIPRTRLTRNEGKAPKKEDRQS